jgi:hypothetical protein
MNDSLAPTPLNKEPCKLKSLNQIIYDHPRVVSPIMKIRRLFNLKHQSVPVKINNSNRNFDSAKANDKIDSRDVSNYNVENWLANGRHVTSFEEFYMRNNKTLEKLKKFQSQKQTTNNQVNESISNSNEAIQKADC